MKARARKGGVPVRLLNAEESATYLGVSLWTLREIVRKGLLWPVRLPLGGRRILLDLRDLDALIAKSKRDEGEGGGAVGVRHPLHRERGRDEVHHLV